MSRNITVVSRKRIIVELTPAAIDGAVIRFGRVVRTARIELDPTIWRQAWEEGLSPFDAGLRELVAALDAAGANVDIAYRSPTSFADVITVPVTGSAVEGAAQLSLAEHVGFDLQMNPHSISPITSALAGGVKVTHALALADQASVSETLAAWLDRAGCRLACACPASALTMGDAIDQGRKGGGDSISVQLFIDRRCAMLTVASGSSVRLVRRIEIGFEDFAEAITRPILRRDAAAESVSLTPTMASAILCDFGIPGFQTVIDEALDLKGKDILPLIQPALQRMAIEVKQSLRFELSEEERESIKLKLIGPFGSVPNLASAICDQMEIALDGSYPGRLDRSCVEEPFLGQPGRPGRLARLVRTHSLVSEQITSDQRVDSFRIGARAGAIAAALALVATAFVMNAQIQSQRQAAKNLDAAMVTVEQIIGINESIQIRSDTLAATQQRMGEAIGLTMRWADVLSVMPGLVPETVTLNEIEGAEGSGKELPKIDLSGVACSGDGQTCQESLNEFIEALNDCPLVANVDLGVTNRVGGGDTAEAVRFSITVNLVATPRQVIAFADGEETP